MVEYIRNIFYKLFEMYGISDFVMKEAVKYYFFACFIYLLLRVLMYISMKSKLSAFRFAKKDFPSKDKIIIRKNTLIGNAIKAYIEIAEKGVRRVNTEAVVESCLFKARFLIFKYEAVSKAMEGLEYAFALIGGLLWATFSYNLIWVFCTATVFIIIKLSIILFNFEILRERLKYNLINYIENEIAKFYAVDFDVSMNVLKAQITALMEMINLFREDKKDIEIMINALREQFNYIENNQDLLKESMIQYEKSFENMTKDMGEAFGSIIEYKMQKTYSDMLELIKDDFKCKNEEK